MNDLTDYADSLAHNIEKLKMLLTRHQYIEALACMDERLALIAELTNFASKQAAISAEIAILAGNQLEKERTLRNQVDILKEDVTAQLLAINTVNKLKSVYGAIK